MRARLAVDGAGHRRRHRRLVGGLATAGSTAARAHSNWSAPWLGRRRAARPWRRLRLGLAGIKFRLLALAVERVEAGVRLRRWRRAGHRSGIWPIRDGAGVSLRATPSGSAGSASEVVAGVVAGLAQRRILRREKAVADRAQQIGGQGLGLRRTESSAISARHGKARATSVTRLRRPVAGPDITIRNTPANSYACRPDSDRSEPRSENVVNGVKTIMVNEPLRTGRSRRLAGSAVLGEARPRRCASSLRNHACANSKPLMANSTGTDPANAAVQSALRTLEAEGSGIAAIEAALRSDLGDAFAARRRSHSQRQGTVDRHRARQVRPYRPQDRRDLCLHRHAGLLRACRGSRPRRSRHDHHRRRHPGAVVVRRAAGDEDADHLRQALPDRADRDDGGARLHR